MRKRNFTDMIDEKKQNIFDCIKYKYDIEKKKNKRKQVIINAPLIRVYGQKIKDEIVNIIKDELLSTFKINKYKNICVVGLGNREILNDALGPCVLKKLLVTRGLNINPQLSVIYPNVYSQTGIESADLILSICDKIKPDLVILIDALATLSLERLCSSFQLNVDGIQAGSGSSNNNKKITKKLLGCDVFSIGVPMMIYAENFKEFKNKKRYKTNLKNVIFSPCDIKKNLNLISKIIAEALNSAIFSQYNNQEIETMIN